MPLHAGNSEFGRRTFLLGAGTAAALASLPAVPASAAAPGAAIQPASADELAESGPLQNRWLSLPMSRLIINPYNTDNTAPPLQYSVGPNIPLTAGYYAADYPWELDDLLVLYRKLPGKTGSINVAFEDDFDDIDPAWVASPKLEMEIVDGQLKVTNPADAPNWFGTLTRTVEIDLDAAPYLQISVTSLADAWGMHVSDGAGSDIVIQGDSNNTGNFTYDLPQLTGWSGKKQFQIILRVAIWDKPATFDSIRILGADAVLEGATSFDATWLPYELPLTATYTNGSTIENHDFFHDEKTILRATSMHGAGSTWTVGGHFTGTADWDSAHQVLAVRTDEYAYAVAFSASVGATVLYPTLLEMLAGTNPLQGNGPEGYWAVDLDQSDGITVAVSFATNQDGGASRATAQAIAARRGNWVPRRDARRRAWDRLLAQVPRPHSFQLTDVDPKGTTPSELRLAYYRAWAFLLADSLPPAPEAGFPYPQLATGKPSLWKGGAAKASFSASWDSILGMQYFAYYDPGTAWKAFTGIMALVGPDGSLGGEALPSRKAQTAWILFQLTGDKQALRGIYPALRRLLLWEEANPRWIQPGHHDIPTQRDGQFGSELLIDMTYVRQIADELGMPSDVAFWKAEQQKLFQQFLFWCFPTPTSQPFTGYDTGTKQHSPATTIQVDEYLHIDLWTADSPQLSALKQYFDNNWSPTTNFAKFIPPRHPVISYTIYGLLDWGMPNEASVLAQATVRDIARAGMFAETYDIWPDPPTPSGVRPSLFAVMSVIDNIWMMNGYRMDLGWPHLVRLNSAGGGIDNLLVRGKRLNLAAEQGSSITRLSGSLVHRNLTVEIGETVPVPR